MAIAARADETAMSATTRAPMPVERFE